MSGLLDAIEELTWRKQIEEWRRERDNFFRHEATSPLTPERRLHFLQLGYFPPDSEWRRPAIVERRPGPVALNLVAGRGIQPTAFVRYARAEIRFPAGQTESVSLFTAPHQHEGHDEHEPYLLYLPFRDGTSGRQTYASGRYLEIANPLLDGARRAEGVIDFNFATNPWCAYNEGFVCPLPPEENWLRTHVRAGEQSNPIFIEHHQ